MQNEIIYSTKNNIPVTFTTSELVKVMLDPRSFRQKPTEAETGAITNRLVKSAVDISVEELAEKVGKNGQTFAPGYCEGSISTAGWVSQQLFGLDFDKNFNLDQFDDRCKEIGIFPSFVYYTFSHTPSGHRFRAVFVLDHIVFDTRVRKLIVGLFLRLFPEADKACSNPSRIYYGGKGLYSTDFEQTVNPQQLFETCMTEIKRTAPGHFKEYREKFLDNMDLDCGMSILNPFEFDEIESDCGEKTVSAYYIIQEGTKISPISCWVYREKLFKICWKIDKKSPGSNSTGDASETTKCKNMKSMRLTTKMKKHLVGECQLVREFFNGTKRIDHMGRLIIASNLLQLVGGEAWYKKKGLIHFSRGSNPYPASDKGILDAVKDHGYSPFRCERSGGSNPYSCPYADSCNHQTNLLQQIPHGKAQIEKIGKDLVLTPLRESRSKLEVAVGEFLLQRDSKGKISIIKSDCGLGKTEFLLRLLPQLDNICICFPTHKLAREAYRRYGRGDYFLWPEPPELPDDLKERLNQNHAAGLSGQQKIYKQALEHDEIKDMPKRRKKIQKYIKAVGEIHEATRIFTTHEKAHHLIAKNNANISTYVFDEDPLDSLLRSSQVKLQDIKKFIEHVAGLQKDGEFQHMLDYLWKMLSLKPNVVHTPDYEGVCLKSLYKLIQSASGLLNSPVGRLFDCHAMVVGEFKNGFKSDSIQCVTERKLPEDKNIVVMSATPISVMYEGLYGNRVEIVDLAGTEKKGKVVVHPEYSYSRSSIQGQGKKFAAEIVKGVEEHNLAGVITFLDLVEKKGAKSYLADSSGKVEILGTFGSVLGLNSLTGRNLGIVGTYRVPESSIRIYAHFAGLLSKGDRLKFERRSVVRNGYKSSRYCCSDDEKLQELEFGLIDAEILQAVGRARLLENDCEVHVWSDHLLTGCELWKEAG